MEKVMKRAFAPLIAVMLLVCGLALAGCQAEEEKASKEGRVIDIYKPITVCYDMDDYRDRLAVTQLPDYDTNEKAFIKAMDEMEEDLAREALEGIGARDISFERDSHETLCVSCKVPEEAWKEFAATRCEGTISFLKDVGLAFVGKDNAVIAVKPSSVEISDQCDSAVVTVNADDLAGLTERQILQGYYSVRLTSFEPLYFMLHDYTVMGETYDGLSVTIQDEDGDVIMDNEKAQALLA